MMFESVGWPTSINIEDIKYRFNKLLLLKKTLKQNSDHFNSPAILNRILAQGNRNNIMVFFFSPLLFTELMNANHLGKVLLSVRSASQTIWDSCSVKICFEYSNNADLRNACTTAAKRQSFCLSYGSQFRFMVGNQKIYSKSFLVSRMSFFYHFRRPLTYIGQSRLCTISANIIFRF